MVKVVEVPVRYGETDCMGVVHHANYPLYFEDAREKFIADLGFPYAELEKQNIMAPVTEMHLSYSSSLKYGDTALIRIWVSKLTAVRVTYSYEIFRKGMDLQFERPCVTGFTTLCIVDSETFEPLNMRKACPELYAKYKEAVECELDEE